MQRADGTAVAARLIRDHKLPREAVPTQYLGPTEVWDALCDDMPMTAMIRNLATTTKVGLLTQRSDATARVVAKLADGAYLGRARIHPMAVLIALRTYASGRGLRGHAAWTPIQKIVDALDDAFYATFDNVVPTGARQIVAVDCSGSMSVGGVAGVPSLSAREAAAAMALITLRMEPNAEVIGFTTGYRELRISARQRLDDVMAQIQKVAKPEGTDCSVPMRWAIDKKVDADVFSIYTDGQTWAGAEHPVQAMAAYRHARVPGAKMVSVAFVGYGDSVVDGNDAGMLDVVGFDTAAPALIGDFVRGS